MILLKRLVFLFLFLCFFAWAKPKEFENEYLKIKVDHITGRFTIYKVEAIPTKIKVNNKKKENEEKKGAKKASVKTPKEKRKYHRLVYDKFPYVNYTTIYINGMSYVFGSPIGAKTLKASGGKLTCKWIVPGLIEATQTLTIVEGEDTNRKDNVEISYTVKNISTGPLELGIRVFFDFSIAPKPKLEFATSNSDEIIKGEYTLSQNLVPNEWFMKLVEKKMIIKGTVSDNVSKVVVSTPPKVYKKKWDIQTRESGGKTPTAVAIYHGLNEVLDGSSMSAMTTFGLSDRFNPRPVKKSTPAPTSESVLSQLYEKEFNMLLSQARVHFGEQSYKQALSVFEEARSIKLNHQVARMAWEENIVKLVENDKSNDNYVDVSAENALFIRAMGNIELGLTSQIGEIIDELERKGQVEENNLAYLRDFLNTSQRKEKRKHLNKQSSNYKSYLKVLGTITELYKNGSYELGVQWVFQMLKLSPFDETAAVYLEKYSKKVNSKFNQRVAAQLFRDGNSFLTEGTKQANAEAYFSLLQRVYPDYEKEEVARMLASLTEESSDKISSADIEKSNTFLTQAKNMMNDVTAAMDVLRESVSYNPNNREARELLNEIYLKTVIKKEVDPSIAIESQKQASLKKINVRYLERLAEGYRELGYAQEALDHYEKVLVLSPNNQSAAESVNELKNLMFGRQNNNSASSSNNSNGKSAKSTSPNAVIDESLIDF